VVLEGREFRWMPEEYVALVSEQGAFPKKLGGGDWVTVLFDPAFVDSDGGRVVECYVEAQAEPAGGGLRLDVYNRHSHEWDACPAFGGRVPLRPLENYLDPRFPRVRLRLMVPESAGYDREYRVKDVSAWFVFEGGGGGST
jgi:hypothetical protein